MRLKDLIQEELYKNTHNDITLEKITNLKYEYNTILSQRVRRDYLLKHKKKKYLVTSPTDSLQGNCDTHKLTTPYTK